MGYVPAQWKEAIIAQFNKPDKDQRYAKTTVQ